MLSENGEISADDLDYLVMPYDSLGSTPVFEALKRNIPVYAVKENTTALQVSPEKIDNRIIVVNSYQQLIQEVL